LGVERLRSVLRSRNAIALDTSVLIYQLEKNLRYFPLSDAVFAWLDQPNHSAITSTLSMTELLVPVHRDGNARRLHHYRGLLTTYSSLAWLPPDLAIADRAAQLRAEYRLKTPDAIQAATAIRAKVSTLFTNDPIFQRVKELEIFVFDDLL
jgi:predicted nucleic acid-binding protein